VAASLDRPAGHLRIRPADVLERGQHPVGHEYRRADPAQDVGLIRCLRWPRPGDGVLQAEPAGDQAGDDHVGVAGEPVRAGQERHPRRGQRSGDQPGILTPGQRELDRRNRLAQRPDGLGQGLGDPVRPRDPVRPCGLRVLRAGPGYHEPPVGQPQSPVAADGADAAERRRRADRVAEAEKGADHGRVGIAHPPGDRGRPARPVADHHGAAGLGQVDRVDAGQAGACVHRRSRDPEGARV